MNTRIAVGLVCVALLGCQAAKTSSQFPSREKLLEVTQREVPKEAAELAISDVEEWELQGPFPAGIGDDPIQDPTRWERAYAEGAPDVRLTESMRCVAREVGRFYLHNEHRMSQDLENFILSRCGASTGGFSHALDVSKGESDEDGAYEHAGESVKARAQELAGQGEYAGIWYGQHDDQHVIAYVVGKARVRLESIPREATAETVPITGHILEPAESVDVFATTANLGAVECKGDLDGDTFAFECPVSPEEDYVSIDISIRPPRRFLSHTVALLMVTSRESLPTKYVRPDAKLDLPPLSTESKQRLVSALNSVRVPHGLEAVSEAPAQSATAESLVPYYLSSVFGFLPQTVAETIALGLQAGWDVSGEVRYGTLTSSFFGAKVGTDRMLASALDRPLSRAILMDPAISQLAVGLLETEQASGMILAGYALFGDDDTPQRRLLTAWRAIKEQRLRAGQAEPIRVGTLESATEAARARIEDAGDEPRKVLQSYMQDSANLLRSGVEGFYFEVEKLEDLRLPKTLLNRPELEIDIAIARYKPDGEPWTRYVVLVVVAGSQKA